MSFKTSIKYKVFLFQCLIFFCNFSYSQNKFIQELSKAECDSCKCTNCNSTTTTNLTFNVSLDSVKIRGKTYYPYIFSQKKKDTIINGYFRFTNKKLFQLDVAYNDSEITSLDSDSVMGIYGDISKEVLFLDFNAIKENSWDVYHIGMLGSYKIELDSKHYNKNINDTIYKFNCESKPEQIKGTLSHDTYKEVKNIYASPNYGITKIILKSKEGDIYKCNLKKF